MRRTIALSVLALAASALAVVPPAAGDPPEPQAGPAAGVVGQARGTSEGAKVARAPLPKIDWKKCDGVPPRLARRASCAEVRVPLDYDDPRGATTKLLVTKMAAAKPGRRIGSLFVNPGGPGQSSASFALGVGPVLGKQVNNRFDVIGIDPRGVGGSGSTLCAGRLDYPDEFFGFPINKRQSRAQIRYDNSVRKACHNKRTPLVDHASTADVARDMELIRRAIREPKLTYYGISYGSYLGSTYAAMFPNRIRALVVDGVLDPVAWSTGGPLPTKRPLTYRLGSGKGAYEALTAAWTECDRVGKTRCALAPSSLTKWRQVLRAARQGRLTDGEASLSYQDVVSIALSSLYGPDYIRPLANFVNDLDSMLKARARSSHPRRAVDASALPDYRQLMKIRAEREKAGPYTAPGFTADRAAAQRWSAYVQFESVLCSDGRNPRSPKAWIKTSRLADRTQPWFGRSWTWSSSACAKRGIGDSSDAFRGPWAGTKTSYPLLVVGNTHDPATPVRGARKVNSLFKDSAFVLYDAWGHGALGGAPCIRDTMQSYLVNRTVPPNGKVCKDPKSIFPKRG
ncbi:alpha/beta fold hydrolase [Nocardioides sp. GXZ039]|uniref:alpha/beta fold hydrolase n=1 Tax=Nocardioides sp. GXZ039 TaxID=3136018 RepID=UPI0030F3801A